MAITAIELFNSCGLEARGPVDWGTAITDNVPGCYIVSLPEKPADKKSSVQSKAPISVEIIENWIARVPNLLLDSKRPEPAELESRLAHFWLPSEKVLYIGRAATSVRKRVAEYYRTPLGDRAPHHGGHWLKTLSILNELKVHWAISNEPEKHESVMLRSFAQSISEKTRNVLFDPNLPLPFANIKNFDGANKRHGISNPALK